MNVLESIIEKDRENMIKTAHKYGMISEKAIKASQELDKLLNLIRNKPEEKA